MDARQSYLDSNLTTPVDEKSTPDSLATDNNCRAGAVGLKVSCPATCEDPYLCLECAAGFVIRFLQSGFICCLGVSDVSLILYRRSRKPHRLNFRAEFSQQE